MSAVATAPLVWHYTQLSYIHRQKDHGMQHGPNTNTQSQNNTFFKQMMLYALYPIAKALAVPPTQPFAKIAAEQQKNATSKTGPLNFWRTASNIYAKRGMIGFWDATSAGMAREGSKSIYKGYLQVNAKDFAHGAIPESMYASFMLRGIIAGTIVGFFDPTIAAPIERYKMYKLTTGEKINFFGFLSKVYAQQPNNLPFGKTQGVINELYRALGVTIAKQTLMNTAFFATDAWASQAVKPYEAEYPVASVAFSSLAAAGSAALVGAPLDVAKTLKQMQTGASKSTLELIQAVLATSGWRGLFAGVPSRFLLIGVGYEINALFLKLMKAIRQDVQSPKSPSKPGKSDLEEGVSDELINELAVQFKQLEVTDPVNDLTQRLDHLSVTTTSQTLIMNDLRTAPDKSRVIESDDLEQQISKKTKNKPGCNE